MSNFDLSAILVNIAISIPGFLLAIVAHEAAHAYVAYRYGDSTAKDQGRLSLNPAVHYDMWGTILLPLLAAFSGWAVIGYAKPVPIDPRRFSNVKKGIFWVSFAGPLSNIILGTLSAMALAWFYYTVPQDFSYFEIVIKMLRFSIFINFILAVFNLIPLPPLDGSKMVSVFLKPMALRKYEEFGRFTPMIFLSLIALSVMGVHIFAYILYPAQVLEQGVMTFFLQLFG